MRTISTPKFYLLVILLSSSLCSFAQRFDSVLSKLDREYKQEKIYIHFDRAVYTPGETIWLKAYLFTGNYPSRISKTLYAELLDDKGKVLELKSAPVLMSGAAAAFDIPANITGSVVYVRTYTKWMLNFDSSFIYTKAIPIATLKKSSKYPVASNISLQFFPEGGDLVHGVSSRVAFKATDNTGMPANISGDITDTKGNKVLSFTSVHDGMGSFELLPKTGEAYKATWKDKTGKEYQTLLPAAKPTGVVLEVNSNSLQVEFKIKRTETGALPYPFVYLVAQMNHKLLYKAKANLGKTSAASGIIPLENVSAGIVQVTLFSPDEKPIAERITFVNPSASSFITDLNTSVKDLGKRKKNIIQIDVPDTLPTNLSVSITDAELDPVQQGDNIFSSMLLTGDIKGYVHQPAYYFSSDADSVLDHLDLVMMTNGWRRFNWEKVMANKWPKLNYQPENYLEIEGQVSGLNKALLANREVNTVVELKDKKREYISVPVMADGKFVLPEMLFYDTVRFFYQFNNDKKKELTSKATFQIKNNLLRVPLALKPDDLLLLSLIKPDNDVLVKNIDVFKDQSQALEMEKVKVLKDVVVTTKNKSKQELLDEEYTSGMFSGGNSRTVIPEDDPAFLSAPTLLDYLQNRVAGLQVNPSISEDAITRRGFPTALFVNEISQESISMTTDGKRVQDASYLLSIPMGDIALVKIFDPPFVGAGGSGPGGAIAVYLKKGVTRNGAKGLDFVNISGYTPVREFYLPGYSNPSATSVADLRKTLYWSPFIITDKKTRRIFLPFYNNDITKKIKIIIEGFNEDGKLTRVEKVLQ